MVERTGKTTVRGRPVYLDPTTGEQYSEKTVTFPYGDGYLVMPSVVDNGMQLSEEELYNYAKENGPYDFLTGERLPVHKDLETADRYAQWRSDNQFNEAILDENYWHRDAGMPYYSESTLEPYRPTLRDNARNNIREGLQGLGLSDGVSYQVAKGIAGEENPTDGGLGIGLMDFTPAGMAMGVQEARRDYNRASENEDYVGMGLAGLGGALSVAEALPVAGVAAKAAVQGIKKGAAKLTDAAMNPNAVGSFGGNLFAKGFDEPSDKTLDALRSSYPNMEARDEVYRVGERKNNSGGLDVRIGPEKPLEEVPLYPSDPERKSVFIDPELARVEYDGELYNKIIPIKGTPRLDDLIEPSDDIIYRGMSAEEYRSALDQGFIKSKGEYNVGSEQEGLTFFSSRPSQAESYANNYTPEGYKATPDRPAYVVSIKRPKKIDYVTGETEIGIKGEIPTSEIIEVYEGRPYVFKGDIGIMDDWGTTRTYGSPDVAEVTWEKIDKKSPTFAPKKTSNMSVLTKDADTDALQTLGLDEATREQWRGINKVNQRQQRVPQIQDAATALKEGEITSAEYRELVESFQPIVPFDSVPPLPTVEEIASALNSDKVRKGIIGVNKGVEDGTYVASRLDIPAYEQYDTWVVSLHDGANGKLNGASIGYSQTAVLNDVTFGTVPKAAVNIASGKDKTTIARIFGSWENKDPEAVHELAQQYMNDPEWVQVGMNPFRHSYFYDKATGEPVTEATEVIQVGPLVLARGVTKASPDDAMFRIDPRDETSNTFALGGLVDAQKGIATEEGKDMANKKFQMDNKKADKDGNGELSAYEKVAGEAVQKAEADAPEQDEKYGMNCGGMMMPEEEMDPVSGNPIPLGSTAANVRDDIEIYVSEGEYVLPADVVKWHGLKHIMEMQDEAKMGLMGMFAEGLIQEVAMEHEEEISEVEETEEEDIPSEDMDVEVAAVEVDDMMDEEEETEELYPEESVLPAMIKKQKYAFIA